MRRVALLALVVVAGAAWLVTSSVRADRDGKPEGDYEVRAIFDNASAAVEGEDVKVAGAKVGWIDKLDVTPDRKAVVVLRINDRRFVPFHADATCKLRPEGVLAVKFVDCDPGTKRAPELRRVERGDGEGQYLLPVQRTSAAIDLDLVNNIYRRPTGQKLAIFLSELGVGLAGRGTDLNAIIHRANPALGELNRFLSVVADQSERLERFAVDAETLLRPLARDRRAIAGFIVGANKTNRSSAARADDVQASIERFPAFLRVLRSQMGNLRAFADQGIPLLTDFEAAGPGLGRMTANLERFAKAAQPATIDLGATSEQITPKLLDTLSLLRRLGAFGRAARPVAESLAALLTSFRRQEGIEHFLQIAYYAANAVNGFDEAGHYARAEPLSGTCSEYTAKGFFGCDAQWGLTATSAKPVNEAPDGTLTPITAADVEATTKPPADSPDALNPTLRILDFLLGP